MPPSPWTTDSERKLFLAIIQLTAPRTPAWDRVATLMGDGKSAQACRQHFNKLRRESKSGSGTPTTANTAQASTPKPRKRKAADFDADNVDDEENFLDEDAICALKKAKTELKAELVKDETKPLEDDNSLYD